MNYWWLLAIIPWCLLGILFLRWSRVGEVLAMIIHGLGGFQTIVIFYGAILLWPLVMVYYLGLMALGWLQYRRKKR